MLRPIAALATFAGMIWAGVALPTGGFVPTRGVPVATTAGAQPAIATGHHPAAARHTPRALRQHDRSS
jgi:hypothetical protein